MTSLRAWILRHCWTALQCSLLLSRELLGVGRVEFGRADGVAKIVNKMDSAAGLYISAVAEFMQTATVNVLTQKCLDVRDPDR